MKKLKVSIILNLIIVILTLFSTISMFLGFHFMSSNIVLSSTSIDVFKFFTVDSNVFGGVVSFILLIYEVLYLKKKTSIPKYVYILKYMACVGLLLTFITTACFLAPFSNYPFYMFYLNSNFFYHFMIPVLYFISFVFFEDCSLKFNDTFLGIIPMVTYSIYYIINVVSHLNNGVVLYKYDFYGFLRGGLNTIGIVVLTIYLVTYIMSLIIYFIKRRFYENN